MGLTLVDEERFARPDTSVAGQVLKLVAANPDAILIGASGTAAGLPQSSLRERGYKGLIYQTHGAASMDFIRIAGPAAEGVIMASGPVMNPEGQPDCALTKKPGLALNSAYEAKYGPNTRSQFAGHAYDAFEVLKRVVPAALKSAKPGTPEFREAIRQAFMSEHEIAATPRRLQLDRKGPLRSGRSLAHHPDREGRQVRAGDVRVKAARAPSPSPWRGRAVLPDEPSSEVWIVRARPIVKMTQRSSWLFPVLRQRLAGDRGDA